MANKRDMYHGKSQSLFRGGPSNKPAPPDLTEREAEQIRQEMVALKFRAVQVRRTTDIQGKHTGFAVEFRDPNTGRFVLVGAWENWVEHKRRLMESLGLALGGA